MFDPTFADHLWTGRLDGEDGKLGQRLYQVIKAGRPSAGAVALIGFGVDEGVRRNGGRVGAAQGPLAIRPLLANLPWFARPPVVDLGNIYCEQGDLASAQGELAIQVQVALAAGAFPLVLGGGHEVAYGTWQGLAQHYRNKKIGIINMDAHFDLRIVGAAGGSSGTPFYQIAQASQVHHLPFHYCCLGISPVANTQALFQRAQQLQVSYRLDSQLTLLHWEAAQRQLQDFIQQVDLLYLTIDLDVFNGALAPGVSAPNAHGISLEVAEGLISQLQASGKLRAAEIAEYNPTFDQDQRTARLAARLFYQIIPTNGVYA